METGYNISDYDPASLFKSYYVVWKQEYLKNINKI